MTRVSARARAGCGVPDEPRYKHKTVRIRPSRQGRVVAQLEGAGWELEHETPGRFRTDLSFRKPKANRPWRLWTVTGGIALILIAAIVLAVTQPPLHQPLHHDPLAKTRDDAAAAIKDLRADDLPALDKQLAAYRGQPDFAYFFTSQTTPRSLGDALASVAGTSAKSPFISGAGTTAYEDTLTDLAGTLALATHGTGDRALPLSWSDDLIQATTSPQNLYDQSGDGKNAAAQRRVDKDIANKQNLLLLISRGYWSNNFLMALTTTYTEYDQAHGGKGWSETRRNDAKYAPAPNGTYLTDGMLALTAALTSNPTASAWAFTDFEPGTETVAYDGDDHPIGRFTHYLFFEHDYPTTSDGDSVGMTATLTALSSAIDATSGVAEVNNKPAAGTPLADSRVLQGLAKSTNEDSGCSFNPLDYGHCVIAAAKDLFRWINHWGHKVLDILALATFAPPPFDAIGIGAAATNATWYAVQGDYTAAGLSLAAALPGLAFTKIAVTGKVVAGAAKGAVSAANAQKAATEAIRVAKIAQAARPSAAVVKAETQAARGVATVNATVGRALTSHYAKTFYGAYPNLHGKVVIHHAVEQQVLVRYPNLFTNAEMHSLENLRGIPIHLNGSLHLSDIRRAWDEFYHTHPASITSREEILNEATEIDRKFGSFFVPKIG